MVINILCSRVPSKFLSQRCDTMNGLAAVQLARLSTAAVPSLSVLRVRTVCTVLCTLHGRPQKAKSVLVTDCSQQNWSAVARGRTARCAHRTTDVRVCGIAMGGGL